MNNAGNLVNRIGLARRRMWYAVFVAVVMFIVAVVGWSKVLIKNDCQQYTETMCNK